VENNKILESECFSFENYKKLVEKYCIEDVREINFQNRIIIPLLDKIFINDDEIEIVDVSTQYKNRESDEHIRKYYANDKTPDILIVKNWTYSNKALTEQNYLVVIEVKSPRLDPISIENKHTQEEINAYLQIGRRVILTDCFVWKFYGFEKETISFILHNENGWAMKKVKNPDFIVNKFGFDKTREESEVWNDLCAYIRNNI
jgi:hypothetical protein